MKTLITITVLLLAAMSLGTSVCAGTTTSGLSGVTVAVTGNHTTGYDYTFTIYNNSVDAFAKWDVLVGDLNIYNVVTGTKATLLAPQYALSPVGWSFSTNGGWKSNTVVKYDASNNLKYFCPPSVAPGGSLSGFVLHYGTAFDPAKFDYETHVYAVLPLTGATTVPQYYQPTMAGLNGGTYKSTFTGMIGTWWDKPGNTDGRTNRAAVPEASTLMLGGLGLLAPMGYALRRKLAK